MHSHTWTAVKSSDLPVNSSLRFFISYKTRFNIAEMKEKTSKIEVRTEKIVFAMSVFLHNKRFFLLIYRCVR